MVALRYPLRTMLSDYDRHHGGEAAFDDPRRSTIGHLGRVEERGMRMGRLRRWLMPVNHHLEVHVFDTATGEPVAGVAP